MIEIEKESIALLKRLELCSQSCANSMDKFKDLGVNKYESNPIVFLIDKFDLIGVALKKSLKENNVILNYQIIVENEFTWKYNNKNVQIFFITDSVKKANKFKSFNSKSIVVNFIGNDNVGLYIDLMVKNIKKNIRFNINKNA